MISIRSNEFQALLTTYQMLSSMSRKGNCWDNAVAESFFGSLKTERVFFPSYKTREEARRDIIDYVEMFYNSKRRHSHLGYLSPREFEKMMELKKVCQSPTASNRKPTAKSAVPRISVQTNPGPGQEMASRTGMATRNTTSPCSM